ncbi:MAG: hypothetical protein ACRDRT_08825, partial [Pseudonocardiaceae bacterium]
MRVVVVGHPRSGSNSLVEVLQCHPKLSLANEPFNVNYASWDPANFDYVARLHSGESFEVLVDELLADFGGIKVMSYQLPGDLVGRLVRGSDVRIIVLRQRNLLQTAVSQLLAEQTGLWKTWDVVGSLEERYRDLEPLDL